MNLCSVSAIKEILLSNGFKFSKSLGQNFLINPTVPERIASALPDDGKWGVLEVGPGIGALTSELSTRAARVSAVELDRRLVPHLRLLFPSEDVIINEGDILKTDINKLCLSQLPGLRLAAFANLPYYITSPVMAKLVESGLFEMIVVMVQKEVAARICAKPGTPDYSSFTVFINYYTDPLILFAVTRGNFYPMPGVDSAVIKLSRKSEPGKSVISEDDFFTCVKAAFSNRRKTLLNCLSPLFSDKEKERIIFNSAGIDPSRRGETLSVPEFTALSNAYTSMKSENNI